MWIICFSCALCYTEHNESSIGGDKMQIERLQYFLAVCHAASITEAANNCNVTQQTVSIAIKELEAALGKTLFYRSKSGVQLTAEGKEVYPVIAQIVDSWQSLLAPQPLAQEIISGDISLALATNFAFFTSDIIALFSNDFPQVNITIHEILPTQDYADMLTKDHDILLYSLTKDSFSPEALTQNPDYVQSVLFMDSIVIMASKNSPYAKYKVLPKKAPQEWPWITYAMDKNSLPAAPVHKLIFQGTTPKNQICVSNYSALFDSIIYHNYVAVSSSIIKRSAFYREKKLALIKLPQKIDSYCILAVKKEKADDFLIQNLITLLKKLFVD